MLHPSQLQAPDEVIDYGCGVIGPVMLHWAAEGQDVEAIIREAGFESHFLSLDEDDANEQLHIDYSEYGDIGVLEKWQPTSPGEGWKLVGKNDTDDGPCALFVRPLLEPESQPDERDGCEAIEPSELQSPKGSGG